MGMGEPMMNLDNVLGAARRLPDLGITHRRTGISTVGWAPGIRKLTESDMPIRLALSLHAPEDALRSKIMPVNERYSIAEVLAACEAYYERRQPQGVRRVRDARRRQRQLRPGGPAREAARPADLQAQPDPVQPDRTRSTTAHRAARSTRSRPRSRSTACARRSASPAAATSTPPAGSSRRRAPLGAA